MLEADSLCQSREAGRFTIPSALASVPCAPPSSKHPKEAQSPPTVEHGLCGWGGQALSVTISQLSSTSSGYELVGGKLTPTLNYPKAFLLTLVLQKMPEKTEVATTLMNNANA